MSRFGAVPKRALSGFLVLAPLILGAMVLRAGVLGSEGALTLGPIVASVGALFVGCVVFALVTSAGSTGWRGFFGWVLGGSASFPALFLLLALVMPMDAGDRALFATWEFWGFFMLIGGITGGAYWMIAQGIQDQPELDDE